MHFPAAASESERERLVSDHQNGSFPKNDGHWNVAGAGNPPACDFEKGKSRVDSTCRNTPSKAEWT